MTYLAIAMLLAITAAPAPEPEPSVVWLEIDCTAGAGPYFIDLPPDVQIGECIAD